MTELLIRRFVPGWEKPEDPEAPVHEGWTFQGWIVGEPVTGGDGTVTVTITATYEMDNWTVRDTLPAIQTLPASLAAVWGGGTGGSGGGGHRPSGGDHRRAALYRQGLLPDPGPLRLDRRDSGPGGGL